MTLHIYLSGKIKKSHEEGEGFCWGKEEISQIKEKLFPICIDYLDPSHRADDLADHISIFGRDLLQVSLSDIVFADVRERRGIGVGGEIIFAGWIDTPVISICPLDSFYRPLDIKILDQPLSSWTHPFVGGPSIYVASTVQEAAQWIKENKMMSKSKEDISNRILRLQAMPLIFKSPIKRYIEYQLEKDVPMKEFFEKNRDLVEIIKVF